MGIKLKNSNKYQGISHLMIIAFVPLLMVGAYFTDNILIRVVLILLLLFLFVFIWKKLVIKG